MLFNVSVAVTTNEASEAKHNHELIEKTGSGYIPTKYNSLLTQEMSKTVRRWIKSGRLMAIRLPSGHYRIDDADYRDFLENCNIELEEGALESKSKQEGGEQ